MKRLPVLIRELHGRVFGPRDIAIYGISSDSKTVKRGDLFVAISGTHFDGHTFIPDAISKGAVAIVGEKDIKNLSIDKKITYVKVPSSRYALSLLASSWYDHPSKKLRIIGVTGTDGKTTTATLIYWILKVAGKKVGLISTVSAKIGEKEYDTGFHVTNPEPLPLQKFLDLMVEKGCELAVLEVTSHGLAQERVAGIRFEVSILTNITHEHLDYHKTFSDYVKAKSKLFLSSKVSVLNKDDDSFTKVRQLIGNYSKIVPYNSKSLRGEIKEAVLERFREKYNQVNSIAAITVAKIIGLNEKLIIQSIKSFPQIEGRMQEVKNNLGVRIIIDFAHTPNAIKQVLTTLREQKKESTRLIVVFGCAGERDKEKRPVMGKISARSADISVFTAEDPRSEDVSKIIDQMIEGAKKITNAKFHEIPERGKAIAYAIKKLTRKGDIVVICGKGHEKSMAYGGVEYPWSDQKAVKTALEGKVEKIGRK